MIPMLNPAHSNSSLVNTKINALNPAPLPSSSSSPFKTIHRLNENWNLCNKLKQSTHHHHHHQPTSTNSSTSFSSASTNSTSTIVNNAHQLSTIFDGSHLESSDDLKCVSPHVITDEKSLSSSVSSPKQYNNDIYNEEANEENMDYFYDENYELNTCDLIDDNDKDVLSLNVDFSNEGDQQSPNSHKSSSSSPENSLRLLEQGKTCSVFNMAMHSCEINPKKYSLELSELSSELLTSSATMSSSSSSTSSSSSITYYDDFYVSSKLKRDKQKKQKKHVRHSSTFSMSKNLTYVSSYDRNVVVSSSSLRKYSMYANEVNSPTPQHRDEVTQKKQQQQQSLPNRNFTNSSSSLSLLVDSPPPSSSSSSPSSSSSASSLSISFSHPKLDTFHVKRSNKPIRTQNRPTHANNVNNLNACENPCVAARVLIENNRLVNLSHNGDRGCVENNGTLFFIL